MQKPADFRHLATQTWPPLVHLRTEAEAEGIMLMQLGHPMYQLLSIFNGWKIAVSVDLMDRSALAKLRRPFANVVSLARSFPPVPHPCFGPSYVDWPLAFAIMFTRFCVVSWKDAINIDPYMRQYQWQHFIDWYSILPRNFAETIQQKNAVLDIASYEVHNLLSTDWSTLRVHSVGKNPSPIFLFVTSSKWPHKWGLTESTLADHI